MTAKTRSQNPRDIIYTPAEVSSLVVRAIEERKNNPGAGLRLGISDIDAKLMPLRPGELVSVLGRPNNFKSGLMQYWARKVAKEIIDEETTDEMVVYVTWEMAVEELGLYDIASAIPLDASEIYQGSMSEDDWHKLQVSSARRSARPIWILGHSIDRRKKRPRLTLTNVAEALLWIEDEMGYKPRAIFLDYLQRMEPESGEKRRLQITENVQRCKDMALAMGCPVIMGVQASRAVDDREWKLPRMADAQESSSIEQVSDKMLSVWYPARTNMRGSTIPDTEMVVTDNLLLIGLIKQKLGSAGHWFSVYVDPTLNKIAAMERRGI